MTQTINRAQHLFITLLRKHYRFMKLLSEVKDGERQREISFDFFARNNPT